MSPQMTAAPRPNRTSSAILRHWPTAVGLLGAAFAAIGSPNRETVVVSLLVALVCYLAAAALGVRWVAWVAIPVASAWSLPERSSALHRGLCSAALRWFW